MDVVSYGSSLSLRKAMDLLPDQDVIVCFYDYVRGYIGSNIKREQVIASMKQTKSFKALSGELTGYRLLFGFEDYTHPTSVMCFVAEKMR